MNQSSQHNQQSESEVKEICIYQNMKSGCHSIYFWKKTVGFMAEESQATISESSHVQ